jgi:O-antigen biosynthesis protein
MMVETPAESPKRVTLVANEFRGLLPVGGMGTATTFLALALARMGHSVELLFAWQTARPIDPHWADVYRQAGVRIRAAPETEERVEPSHFVEMRRVEAALRARPPDVVVVHDLGAPAYSALRLRQAGLGFENSLFVVFCHGTRRWVTEMGRRLALKDLEGVLAMSVLEQASVELADVVVSPSAYLVDWMRDHGWRLPQWTFVIPYITRSVAFGEQPSARSADGEPLQRLAFFGRLEDKKGLRPFAAGLNALEPALLEGLELEFVGKPTATWTSGRVEMLFSPATKRALRVLSFEHALDQPEALARLRRSGTLAVMPSLGDNSPNTVYECLEHGIPFIASNVGGIPELIAAEDRARVLFEPTPTGVEAALRDVLSVGQVPRPVRPGFKSTDSFERWADVIGLRPRARAHADAGPVDVVVVHHASSGALSRCLASLDRQRYADFRVIVVALASTITDEVRADLVLESDGCSVELARLTGLRAASAPYVVFLEGEDVADDELLMTLVRTQVRSGADVVSCGMRVVADDGDPTLRFFSGESGGLGVLSNVYGNIALFRRSVLDDLTVPAPGRQRDADWPLLARLEASGARIVSVPVALATRSTRPGSVDRDPSDALLAAVEIERALPAPLRSTARLAAGLTANARVHTPASPARFAQRALRRLLRSVR